MKRRDKLRVKRKRYYRITAVIIISFLIFELISNFTYILYMRLTQENISRLVNVDMEELLVDYSVFKENGLSHQVNLDECRILLIGDLADNGNRYIVQELEYTKENYSIQSDITGTLLFENIETIILSKSIYTEEEKSEITALISKGVDLIFTKLPDEIQLNTEWGKTTFGVVKDNGNVTYKGLRFISNFFIGDMLELVNYPVAFRDVELVQGCKVYAYSLMDYYSKDYEEEVPEPEIGLNENMPPLIWRHVKGESEIFIINGDFMEKAVSPGIINSVISKLNDIYIYPVVGGKSIYFLGIPYTSNENTEKMQELYSRDALGVQQDLIFPGIVHLVSKYNLFPCYYTSDLDEFLKSSEDKDISYYMKELTKQTATLGYINDNQDFITYRENKTEFTVLKQWNSDFLFSNGDNDLFNLPLIEDSISLSESDILMSKGVTSSYGYMSNIVDLRGIVYPDDEKENWVSLQKDLSTMLSYQNEQFGYLDNLNTEDTIKRLLIYILSEPKITYSENRIRVFTENFYGEAHFIIRTRNEILEVVGGTYEKIGEEEYMIYQQEEAMTIIYKEGF